MKTALAAKVVCAAVLIPCFAPGQTPATPETQAKTDPPVFKLTELQKARLDAARQKVWRWQDKINEALTEFSQLCAAAQEENKWPAVQCNLNDLAVTAVAPPPAPAEAQKK